MPPKTKTASAQAASSEASMDRRLRSVYEMIDSRNYKASLKQITALQQKTNDNAQVMVIKAIVLERMGKAEEALGVCREVKAKGAPALCDEHVLTDLHQVLARLGHGGEATEAFEVGAAGKPDDFKLQQALFGAYVRDENFVKQQLVAMRMYKKKGSKSEQYIMWAVCSLMLQALELSEQSGRGPSIMGSPSELRALHPRKHLLSTLLSSPMPTSEATSEGASKATSEITSEVTSEGASQDIEARAKQSAEAQKKQKALLHLAEALARKHISEHGHLNKLESLLLLVLLLRLQGKHSEALSLLSGPSALLFTIPADLLTQKAEIYLEWGQFEEAVGVERELLHFKRADDWITICQFLDTVLLADVTKSKTRGTDPDTSSQESKRDPVAARRFLERVFGDEEGAMDEEGEFSFDISKAVGVLKDAMEELKRVATESNSNEPLESNSNGSLEHPKDTPPLEENSNGGPPPVEDSKKGTPPVEGMERLSIGNGREENTSSTEQQGSTSSTSKAGETSSSTCQGTFQLTRNLILAELEVARRCWRLTSARGRMGMRVEGEEDGVLWATRKTVEMVLLHFSRFGDKSCFASDIRKYVTELPNETKAHLVQHLWSSLGYSDSKTWAESAQGLSGDVNGNGKEGGAERATNGSTREGSLEQESATGVKEKQSSADSNSMDDKHHNNSILNSTGGPTGEAVVPLTGKLVAPSTGKAVGTGESLKRVRQLISVLRAEEIMGSPVNELSDSDLLRRAASAVTEYLNAPLVSRDPKEQGDTEELLQIAANSLVEVYRRQGCKHPGVLLLASRLLNLGLARHPYNPGLNIMLISIYQHLGCPSLAYKRFEMLQTKHIQLDTLGHLIHPGLGLGFTPSMLHPGSASTASSASAGAASASSAAGSGAGGSGEEQLIEASFRFYDMHLNLEAGELTLIAYNQGSFSKVPEFIRLKRRLSRSHHRLTLKLKSTLTSFTTALVESPSASIHSVIHNKEFGVDLEQLIDVSVLAHLSFNEDLSVRPWWNPSPSCTLLDPFDQEGAVAPATWRVHESLEEKIRRENRWALAASVQGMLPQIISLALNPFLPSSGAQSLSSDTPSPDDPYPSNPSAALEALQQKVIIWEKRFPAEAQRLSSKAPPDASGGITPDGDARALGAARGLSLVHRQYFPLRRLVEAAAAVLAACASASPKGAEGEAAAGGAPRPGGSEQPIGDEHAAKCAAAVSRLEALGDMMRSEAARLVAAAGQLGGEGSSSTMQQSNSSCTSNSRGEESDRMSSDEEMGRTSSGEVVGALGRTKGTEKINNEEIYKSTNGADVILPESCWGVEVGSFVSLFAPLFVVCLRVWKAAKTEASAPMRTKDKARVGAKKGGSKCSPPGQVLEAVDRVIAEARTGFGALQLALKSITKAAKKISSGAQKASQGGAKSEKPTQGGTKPEQASQGGTKPKDTDALITLNERLNAESKRDIRESVAAALELLEGVAAQGESINVVAQGMDETPPHSELRCVVASLEEFCSDLTARLQKSTAVLQVL